MKANKKNLDTLMVVWYPNYLIDENDEESVSYEMRATLTKKDTRETKMYLLSAPTKGELWAKLLERLGYHLEESFEEAENEEEFN